MTYFLPEFYPFYGISFILVFNEKWRNKKPHTNQIADEKIQNNFMKINFIKLLLNETKGKLST